ncbi:MAG: flagellar hook-basal body protein FliE [Neobacillus sp.]|jgi:flagellar hook-basal body complex protein FliE|nr:flagellar hook-basal body protein FliE [Neobacillus sp.]
MEVTGLSSPNGLVKISQNPFQKVNLNIEKSSFSNVLQGYLENVNTTVKQAEDLTVKAATGQIENIHDVTIASQQAKLALELTVTVRDKAVEAYQEIMRMQF